jgi:hypothetical protein
MQTWHTDLLHEKVTSVQLITLPLTQVHYKFDVRGSVHHSIFHTEIANKMQQCIKIYYSMSIWSSTCFGWHTAHHQELETALAASGFAYKKGCWTLWLLDADSVQQPQHPTTFHVCKTGGCQCGFELLMMGGVSPKTRWASYRHGIINFDTMLHLVGYFCTNCITNVYPLHEFASISVNLQLFTQVYTAFT